MAADYSKQFLYDRIAVVYDKYYLVPNRSGSPRSASVESNERICIWRRVQCIFIMNRVQV